MTTHGHRGARGYLPENTVESCIEGVKRGAEWIEVDVVVTGDKQILVSHEPWFNIDICTDASGKRMTRRGNIYRLPYEEIKKIDCGRRGNRAFAEQKMIPAYKPLLTDLIKEVDAYCTCEKRPLAKFNIEVKSRKKHEGLYQPSPKVFTKLLKAVLNKHKLEGRVMIQSFDERILIEYRRLDRNMKLGMLMLRAGSPKRYIRKLGFVPFAYNPFHRFLTKQNVEEAHAFGMEIHTWTVNTQKDWTRLIKLGVDGIITDYPGRFGQKS